MAFIKLNEVTLVESAVEPNILIEENGEIKRLPSENLVTPKSNADWNETDPTAPSFILNKPEALGSKVIVYTFTDGALSMNGNPVDRQEVIDEWNAGSILRLKNKTNDTSNILNIYYSMTSGALSQLTLRYFDNSGTFTTLNVTK